MSKKRICLFAGYDQDGIIDTYVINYIKELSHYCDVYYLADSDIEQYELDKLKPYVIKAWAKRHGEYDFGSYSRLAQYYVGWETIESYDELLFVNDSCYLLRSLADVFDDMSSRNVDFWGMQATKGIAKTKNKISNKFENKILMSEVIANKLDDYEREAFYDFLIGSYFLAFSNNVIKSDIFKTFISTIQKEKNKLNIIRKYEIGLTRLMINNGFTIDTYMKHLYPFHPVFTNTHFDMIEDGFPLFKRYFLTQNHYRVPDLYQWEARISNLLPSIDMQPIKDNLYRVCNYDVLNKNLHVKKISETKNNYIKKLAIKLGFSNHLLKLKKTYHLSSKIRKVRNIYLKINPAFRVLDLWIKKDPNAWVFPVCAYDGTLSGNDLAVFEVVKNDPKIKKYILYRSKHIALEGINIEFYHILSKEAKWALLHSGVVFIKHGVLANTLKPLNGKLRKIICLWHGIPLKRIGCASRDFQDRLKAAYRIHKDFYSVICSSEIDRMAMASAYVPLTFEQVWLTGLPRTDFMVKEYDQLPIQIQQEILRLKSRLQGKKLIFFCPTFKNGQDGAYYKFSTEEVETLKQWLDENNAILGIREHMASRGACYSQYLSKLKPLDLSAKYYENIEAIYHMADLLITDYSSAYIDFMVTRKPVISFAYDKESYLNEERGLFYNFDSAVPGPICETFEQLLLSLKLFGDNETLIDSDKYEQVVSIFYKYLDGRNSARVVEKIIN